MPYFSLQQRGLQGLALFFFPFFPVNHFKYKTLFPVSSQPCTSSSGTLAEKVLPAFYPKLFRKQFESRKPGYVQNVDETITHGFALLCFAKTEDLELPPRLSERRYSIG